MKTTENTSTITFRIPEHLKEAIALIADRESRSVSQQVLHFIRQGLAGYYEQHPAAQSQKTLGEDTD